MKGETKPTAAQWRKEILRKEEFIRFFYRLIQIVRIHQENNETLIQAMRSFVSIAGELKRGSRNLKLHFSEGRIFIQDEKMIYRRKTVPLFDAFSEYFERRNIWGLNLTDPFPRISFRQALRFFQLLHYAEQQDSPAEWMTQHLKNEKYLWIEILHNQELKSESVDKKEQARKVYSYALSSVKDVARKLSAHNQAGIVKTLRIAQNMTDLMAEDEPLFKALSTIRIYDDYTFCHSVNVAILAMCIGKRIGLSRKSLERLGLCGMLHDLGKVEIAKEILNKPGKLTDAEFEEIKKHTLHSVRLIARIRSDSERKAKLILPPFEHHLKYDLSGYPQTRRKEPVSLFGRIITIADVYDAITSPRVYRRSIVSPAVALGRMAEAAGKDFDPILLKVFINILGVYPIGTVLRLDSKELVLVKDIPAESCGSRPIVIKLLPERDDGYRKGGILDLREKDPGTGKYLRNIEENFHPEIFGIQPAAFLLA